MWEGWKAGFLAFHPFHTPSFPWPVAITAKARFGVQYTGGSPNRPSFRCLNRGAVLTGKQSLAGGKERNPVHETSDRRLFAAKRFRRIDKRCAARRDP